MYLTSINYTEQGFFLEFRRDLPGVECNQLLFTTSTIVGTDRVAIKKLAAEFFNWAPATIRDNKNSDKWHGYIMLHYAKQAVAGYLSAK